MDRRSFLRGAGLAGTLATAGCIGGGGEVVENVAKTVSVTPYSGWVEKIPDVSDPGGAIAYTAECERPFDVYFFTEKKSYMTYDSFVDRNRSAQTPTSAAGDMPTGSQSIGQTATKGQGDRYRASTNDGGGRQPIDTAGPYYFVLDNSNYPASGGAFLEEQPKPRSVDLDLTVSKKRFGLPF